MMTLFVHHQTLYICVRSANEIYYGRSVWLMVIIVMCRLSFNWQRADERVCASRFCSWMLDAHAKSLLCAPVRIVISETRRLMVTSGNVYIRNGNDVAYQMKNYTRDFDKYHLQYLPFMVNICDIENCLWVLEATIWMLWMSHLRTFIHNLRDTLGY